MKRISPLRGVSGGRWPMHTHGRISWVGLMVRWEGALLSSFMISIDFRGTVLKLFRNDRVLYVPCMICQDPLCTNECLSLITFYLIPLGVRMIFNPSHQDSRVLMRMLGVLYHLPLPATTEILATRCLREKCIIVQHGRHCLSITKTPCPPHWLLYRNGLLF